MRYYQETLSENNRALQQAGVGLLKGLRQVQELELVRSRLFDAKSAVEVSQARMHTAITCTILCTIDTGGPTTVAFLL